MPSDATTAVGAFPLPRVIPCEECRTHRKRCIRSSPDNKCDRCIQRGTSCSFQGDLSNGQKQYDMDNEENAQRFLKVLRSLDSLDEEISKVEIQLQQSQTANPPEQDSMISKDRQYSNHSDWELIIHSPNSQRLTLNVHIKRTEDLLQFINQIYLEFGTNIPRQFSHPRQETSILIPIKQRHFPQMLLQCVREYLDEETVGIIIGFDLRMAPLNSYHQQITPLLVQAYFNCRHTMAPLLHPEYYNQSRFNTIGNHLRLMIACTMCFRNCVNSPFFYLPPKVQVDHVAYYIGCCTDQIEELMLLDNPPLSLSLLLLTLASTYLMLQNPRKSWLLLATARAYLQQHLNDYIDSIMDRDGPSTAELETYKFALIFCRKQDEHVSYIVQDRPSVNIVNLDPELLVPKLVLGDDPMQYAIIKQSTLWDFLKSHANNWIASSVIITDSIRTVNWNTLKKINSEFTAWYVNLPHELKIGDKPFDIAKMDIPENFNTSIACLQLTYYGEWVTVYGNTLNPDITSDSLVDEATLVESTQIVFLASLSVVKVAEFLSRVEMCKIEFYWLLFACEPLLYLCKSTNSHFASEARQALQKALIVLKALLKHNLFLPAINNVQLTENPIMLGQKLVERISNLFSPYGIQF
ncbi:hypothetical protein BGW37DRAFT_473100 [Umbelopsis sp. PMI_123]|nr:hypothetical protein BGW37DRAFT_473100 [Umbelopsis sp. PMI_123]